MKLLINDASALLNLLAADCIAEVAASLGWQFAICPAVLEEATKLRDSGTSEMIPIDLEPLISSKVLQVLGLAGDEEQMLYVQQAAYVDDSEAMSIAVAASRGLDLAIDDKQAANHVHRSFPTMKLWTTPEMLKLWANTASIPASRLQ